MELNTGILNNYIKYEFSHFNIIFLVTYHNNDLLYHLRIITYFTFTQNYTIVFPQ